MLKGVKCTWLSDQEQCIPTQDCMACAGTGQNPCGYPQPLLKVMTRERKPDVVQCSSTMLSGCPREHGLKKQEDWYIHPDRGYTRAYGSVMHYGLEQLQDDGALVEKRYLRQIAVEHYGLITVTAQLDAMYLDGNVAHIKDYKVVDTLSDSALQRKVRAYLPQFSTQRWILDGYGIEVATIDLLFLHQKQRRVVNIWPHGEEEFPDGLVWGFDKTEDYLRSRLPALVSSLQGNLAPPLDTREEFWKCQYCDVAGLCEKAYGKPLPAFS